MNKKNKIIAFCILLGLGTVFAWFAIQAERSRPMTPPPSAAYTELTPPDDDYGPIPWDIAGYTSTPTPYFRQRLDAAWFQVQGENYINAECAMLEDTEYIACVENIVKVYENGYAVEANFDYPCLNCFIVADTPGTPLVYKYQTITPAPSATQTQILFYVEITGDNINLKQGLFVRECGPTLYGLPCRTLYGLISCDYHPELTTCTDIPIPVYEVRYVEYSAATPIDAGIWLNIICHWSNPGCGEYWIPGCLNDGREFVAECDEIRLNGN